MNPIAKELNKILSETIAEKLLSDFGKRIYFPKGIVTQSAEAKQFASRFNATIGMAFEGNSPIFSSTMRKNFPGLTAGEAVAYAPTPGDKELRALWKQEILKKNPGITSQISEPLVVSGLTNGIALVADMFVDPDDPVIIPDMFWGNYRLIFETGQKGRIISFPFFTSEGKLNVNGFKETILKNAVNGKAVVLVNFPNNPTGYSPTTEEAKKLSAALVECAEEGINLLAITDDAYFGLFYEESIYKESLFSLLSNAHPNILAVKVDGATKEEFSWGLRVGFVTFGSKQLTNEHYEALNKKLGGSVRSSVSNCSRPAQSLLIQLLKDPEYKNEKDNYFDMLKKRYNKVKSIIKEREAVGKSGGLRALPFNSGYFMSFDFSPGDAEKLRTELLHSKGIGTISIMDRFLRVAYSSIDEENLEELYSTIFDVAGTL